MSKPRCIRCYFAGDKPATDMINLRYGEAEYALDLCSKHAAEFDDAIWGWLRSAREIETGNFQTATLTTLHQNPELYAGATAPAAPEPVKAAPAARKSTLPPVHVLAEKWRLTDHAEVRLLQRGGKHGFGLREVLHAAEAPEQSRKSKRDDGVWYRLRAGVGVVVNVEQHLIVTVLSPKEYESGTAEEQVAARTA